MSVVKERIDPQIKDAKKAEKREMDRKTTVY